METGSKSPGRERGSGLLTHKALCRTYLGKKYASTRSTRRGGRVVCGDEKYREKIFFCKRFKELKSGEKLSAVEKLGGVREVCIDPHFPVGPF